MPRASESRQASPKRMRLGLALVAVGLMLVIAWFVVDPGALRPVNEESAESPAPSGVAPLPVPEHGIATLADIASIEEDFSRNAALYALIGDATRMRLEEWLAEVETLPPTPHRYDIARVLYIRFTVLDAEAALNHALRGGTKASWLTAIFRTWGQLDPDAAAARAGTLHPSAKAVASRALLELDLPRAELLAMTARLDESRSDRDRQRRVQLMTGKPQLTQNEYLLAEIEARTHARREGESHADAWNRAIGEEEALVRQILVEQTVLDLASTDPVAAMAAVDAWNTDDVYVPYVTGGGFAPSRPIGVIGYVYAGDHAEALRLLDSIEDPPIRIAAAGGIVGRQVRRDAREALAWARDFRPETQRPKLVVQVFDAWSRTDPDGACRALFDTRGGLTRDRAAAAMMPGVVGHDIHLAERLFDSIKMPEHQADAAQILHRYFTEIDSRKRKAERYRKYLPPEDDDPADDEDAS